MSDPDADRLLVEDIFAAIPDLRRFHGRHQALYQGLNQRLIAYFEGGTSDRLEFAPFAGLDWPRVSLGNLSSYVFFTLDEMVLHAFYWRNARRYASFFDVGAHIGIDSLLAAHLGYRVTAFEPDPDNWARMNDILRLNGFDAVDTHCAGISDTSGDVDFVRVKGNTTASHLSGARDFHGDYETFSVHTMTFAEAGPFPDLMKINVEGHETVVVSTIPMDTWQTMDAFIEIHDDDNRDNIYRHFKGSGVHLYCQKTGWRRARRVEDVPATNKEGYVFVSRRRTMPW